MALWRGSLDCVVWGAETLVEMNHRQLREAFLTDLSDLEESAKGGKAS